MTTPKSARGSRACEELCDLSFRHVGYRLRRGGANNGAIDILQDVTGSIRSTALTAILGSSGAGCGLPPWRAAGQPSAQQPRCARPPTAFGGLTGAAWRAGRRRWCGPGPVLASYWWEVSGCRRCGLAPAAPRGQPGLATTGSNRDREGGKARHAGATTCSLMCRLGGQLQSGGAARPRAAEQAGSAGSERAQWRQRCSGQRADSRKRSSLSLARATGSASHPPLASGCSSTAACRPRG